MTAMLTEQLVQTMPLTPHVVTGPTINLVDENRRAAKQRVLGQEEGCFTTYSNDLVERPGEQAFFYSMQMGRHLEPEEAAVPVCFKDFNGETTYGLFAVSGLRSPRVRHTSGRTQCLFVEGVIICEDGRQLAVKGRFEPDSFRGQVVLDASSTL